MTMNDNGQQEVRLGLRDILTLCGLALTLVMAMWAITSDLKVTVAQIGERISGIDARLHLVEHNGESQRMRPRPPFKAPHESE